ncbi:MAG: hypothetical protein Tsb005_17680 [Gammaproteobacteria bacterium]
MNYLDTKIKFKDFRAKMDMLKEKFEVLGSSKMRAIVNGCWALKWWVTLQGFVLIFE